VNPSPSPPTEAERPRRGGLALAFDTIVAPQRALRSVAAVPQSLAACALIAALGCLSTVVYLPVLPHLDAVLRAAGLESATQPLPSRAEEAEEIFWQQAIYPLFSVASTALVLTLAGQSKTRRIPFRLFLSLSSNCYVPAAIGSLIDAVALRVRGFHDFRSLCTAFPDNLAVFANPANLGEIDFLQRFQLFHIWSSVLIAYGFSAFSGIRFVYSLVIALAIDAALVLIL